MYKKFRNLDAYVPLSLRPCRPVLTIVSLRDGNGKLGEDDLRGYDPPLTNSFIAQLLSIKSTADGELVRLQSSLQWFVRAIYSCASRVQDFRDFLNLELAVANPTAPRSVRYFFSILDLDQKGYIIEHDLAYFLKVSLAWLHSLTHGGPAH